MPDSEDRDAKNRKTVESLREGFTPLTERLTPDVEPATIYVLVAQAPEN